MNTFELIKTAFVSLSSNKPRTALTMLGVVIGIGSVISMLAIGNGSQQSIQDSVTSLGSNLLTITSSAQKTGLVQGAGGSGQTLTMEDATAIKDKISNITAVSPEYSSSSQVTSTDSNANVSISGVQPDYFIAHNYQAGEGVLITGDDNTNIARVAVLGPDTATTLFPNSSAIGSTIQINKLPFKVIGITVSKGSTGFTNSDDVVFVPLSTAQKILFGQSKLRTITVQGKDSNSLTQVQADITSLLQTRHKIKVGKSDDFTIRNSADTLSTLTSVTGVFTILLASIGGISLLVGGIGIMNIMIVTVTERTREIGLRKAVGAKNSTVLMQFLIESIILTLFGGLFGVGLGYGVSYVINTTKVASSVISLDSVFLSVGISVLIGIVFGLYPAYRASKLSPIDALRYE